MGAASSARMCEILIRTGEAIVGLSRVECLQRHCCCPSSTETSAHPASRAFYPILRARKSGLILLPSCAEGFSSSSDQPQFRGSITAIPVSKILQISLIFATRMPTCGKFHGTRAFVCLECLSTAIASNLFLKRRTKSVNSDAQPISSLKKRLSVQCRKFVPPWLPFFSDELINDVRKYLYGKELGSKLTYLTELQDLVGQQHDLEIQKSKYREADAAEAVLKQTRLKTAAEYRRNFFEELAKAEQKVGGLVQDVRKGQYGTGRWGRAATCGAHGRRSGDPSSGSGHRGAARIPP